MGYYINGIGVTFEEKCDNLKTKHNASETDDSFKEDLVCVVDNGYFAAAAYCYDENEFKEFNSTFRRKKFFVVPNSKKLSGYD